MILSKKIVVVLLLVAGTASAQEDPGMVKVKLAVRSSEQAIAATDVTGIGGFVGDRLNKNKWNYLEKFPIDNYIRLIEQHDYTAWDWRPGEQPGKWLESTILTAVRTHDPVLEKKARSMYLRILRSQTPDGYVGVTSPSVRTPGQPLRGMDAYELYFLQHALLTAYEVWKDPNGLTAARRLGDYFVRSIGPGKAEFWPSGLHAPENKGKILKGTQHSAIAGHSIHYSWEGTLLIDPMMRLYELTGEKKYFEWCKWVVSNIDKWSGWDAYSNLDKVANGEMTVDKIQPYVHTHTFQMNFLGLLRMYQVSGDPSYLRKVEGVWRDVAARQRYITGGVSVGEHYEKGFIKPLTGEMMETCATMSWMQLSQYLLDLTGDARYADAIEQICWNQVFAEQTIDGDANHYFTPPNGYTPRGYFREPDCCMGSGHRLLSMLPGFIYATGDHNTFYINQFIPSVTTIDGVKISQQTRYPEEGRVVIGIDPPAPRTLTIKIRIPSWCKSPYLSVNGRVVAVPSKGGYATIFRSWKQGDRITLELPMKLAWVRHEHYAKTSDRKPYKTTPDTDAPYALVRGPVVYALDDIWYRGDTADFSKGWMDTVKYVLADPVLLRPVTSPGPEILGPGYEVPILLANGEKRSLPVYPFANIGKWYKDPAMKPDSNAAAWTYAIWLKGVAGGAARVGGAGAARVGGAGAGGVRGAGRKEAVNLPASLSMPKIFGDNMVLQRNRLLPVWGSAAPGEAVSVSFGGQEKTTNADAGGWWKVFLDPLPASDRPADMVINSESSTIRLKNILVGEVWLCSGQSNMEYSMRKNSKFEKAAHGSGPAGELDKAHNPKIRIFLVRNNYSKPDVHIRRTWDTAAGVPLRDFSAAGYFFAKEMYRQLHVPIGIISASVSGSRIEPWLPGSGDEAKDTASTGKFYESMIHPLAPFALSGFLWYQGESNCFLNDTIRYTSKMKTLIQSWRALWEEPDASFYLVQIAPYYYSHSKGGDQAHTPESEPAFWEAQERALALPHTGMIVTTDLVDSLQDLHPAYKWEIGRRLALYALAKDYGKDLVYSGPWYKTLAVKGDKMVVQFSNTGSGLVSKDGRPLNWFFIAGRDHRFVPATAAIEGKDKLVVSAKGIAEPVAIRFGWNEAAQANLFNKEGLPAMPFQVILQ